MWLLRTAVIYQVASIRPFKVFTAANTIVMLCGLTQQTCSNVTDICTTSDTIQELLIYQDSRITHTLCCMSAITTQPLPEGPCTRSNKTSTGVAFKHSAPLSPTRQAPLILVFSMQLTHPHNSGFNFMCSGSWSNASDAPTLSRNTPCMVTMSNCLLNACKSHQQQMFWLM